MTKVSFKGQELTLAMNNYRLYKIANELGAETPAQAIDSVGEVLSKKKGEAISTKGMLGFATIFKHMVLEGAEITGAKINFSEKDYFDILSDEASQGVIEEFFNYLPQKETQKKTEEKGQ